MTDFIRAKCGHMTIAIGEPGSQARKSLEEQDCKACLLKRIDAILADKDDIGSDGEPTREVDQS